jgi:SAM-dependent methyltransferase
MSTDNSKNFHARQRKYFEAADETHFAWQTGDTPFAIRERELIGNLLDGSKAPLLEVGAGEGGNLFHLVDRYPGSEPCVGLDAFLPKLQFAAGHVEKALWTSADAGAQPFADATFETVLIRDVLHHLEDPAGTLQESLRVLRPGGTFVLLEPNAHNPLIRLQMALVAAERGAARSTRAWLEDQLGRLPLQGIRIEPAAPFPLDRVVFHPQFGWPSLARNGTVQKTLASLETLAGRALGPRRWSYWTIRATKSGG